MKPKLKPGDYVRGRYSDKIFQIVECKHDIFSSNPFYRAVSVYSDNDFTYISQLNAIPLTESEIMAVKMGVNIE